MGQVAGREVSWKGGGTDINRVQSFFTLATWYKSRFTWKKRGRRVLMREGRNGEKRKGMREGDP